LQCRAGRLLRDEASEKKARALEVGRALLQTAPRERHCSFQLGFSIRDDGHGLRPGSAGGHQARRDAEDESHRSPLIERGVSGGGQAGGQNYKGEVGCGGVGGGRKEEAWCEEECPLIDG